MNNYSHLAISFLKIILWISLVSASIAILVTTLCLAAVVFDFNLSFLTGTKITVNDTAIKFTDLKQTGTFSFAVFGILIIAYLWIFIKLVNNALNVLYKVDFQNPFNQETSNLITKLGF